ncbi:hypothetical protein BB561_000111 [Smittium simulii]|uniref:Uncharacterized protein n=1 Tax=Smittium simulii TaxID=133385 RepID=A0A2T9Z0L9_9FUNG|nr:hypothetical protein BB561_000111 [Smittium simulii]
MNLEQKISTVSVKKEKGNSGEYSYSCLRCSLLGLLCSRHKPHCRTYGLNSEPSCSAQTSLNPSKAIADILIDSYLKHTKTKKNGDTAANVALESRDNLELPDASFIKSIYESISRHETSLSSEYSLIEGYDESVAISIVNFFKKKHKALKALKAREMAFNPYRDLGDLKDLVKGDFNEADFVQKITVKLAETTIKSNGGKNVIYFSLLSFNPKPYIRSFEYLIESFENMRVELDKEILQLENEVKQKEENHRKNIYKFKITTKTIGTSFEKFETELTEVSGNFVRVGEQLDRISREKSRSEEIKDLVRYFSDFANSEHTLIDDIRSGGYSGQLKTANILRKLNMIIAETEYSDHKHVLAKQNIERYSENFEKDFLGDFEKAYKEESINKMAIAAKTLVEFNGGLSVAKAYINQHPFFLENLIKEPEHDFENAGDRKASKMSNYLISPPKPDVFLEQIFEHTLNLVQGDWQTISIVFPNPAYILQMFIKRIFEQTIQSYLDKLLENAEKLSKHTFLRALASSHAATSQLIKKIKVFDFEVVTPHSIVLEADRSLLSFKGNDGNTENMFDVGTESGQFGFISSRYKRSDSRNMSFLYGENSLNKNSDKFEQTEMINAVAAMISGANKLNKIRKASDNADFDFADSTNINNNSLDSKANADSLDNFGVLSDALERCKDDLFIAFVGGGRYINAERTYLEKVFSDIISDFVQAKNDKKNVSKQQGIFGYFIYPPSGTPDISAGSLSTGVKQDFNADNIADYKPEAYEIHIEAVLALISVHSESISRAVEISKPLDLAATVVSLFKTLIDFIDNKYLSIGLNDCISEQKDDSKSEMTLPAAFNCLSVATQANADGTL